MLGLVEPLLGLVVGQYVEFGRKIEFSPRLSHHLFRTILNFIWKIFN